MTRRHRRTSEPVVGEITILDSLSTSSSAYDSSSYSSLSSDDSSEEIHFDLPWEELVHGLALDLAAHKGEVDEHRRGLHTGLRSHRREPHSSQGRAAHEADEEEER